jgi:hypothetical protein
MKQLFLENLLTPASKIRSPETYVNPGFREDHNRRRLTLLRHHLWRVLPVSLLVWTKSWGSPMQSADPFKKSTPENRRKGGSPPGLSSLPIRLGPRRGHNPSASPARIRRSAEIATQPQSRIRSDAALAVDDFVDAPGRHREITPQTILTEAQGFHKFFPENFPRIHRR